MADLHSCLLYLLTCPLPGVHAQLVHCKISTAQFAQSQKIGKHADVQMDPHAHRVKTRFMRGITDT